MAPKLVPPTAEQRLVMIALPMVEQCACELAATFHPRVKREELLGPGTIGAHEAARRYDVEKHPSFPVYARHRIFGEMLDSIREEHRSLRARVEHAMERAHHGFSAHQEVTVDTFADPEETILEGAREGGDEALAAAFFAAAVVMAREPSPEEAVMELEGGWDTFDMVRDAISSLNPHQREVIHLVYQKDMILEEAALAVGVSEKTAQRRHASALRVIRAFLVARGVTAPRLLGA